MVSGGKYLTFSNKIKKNLKIIQTNMCDNIVI